MKIINLLLAILFLLFAAVQYNDTDSWYWILPYGFVSGTSFAAAKGRYHKGLLLIGLVALLVWMAFLLPGFIDWIKSGMPSIVDEMKTTKPHIEIVREFSGLLVAVLTLGFHYYWAGRQQAEVLR
jgi:Transmembrane family 220, helix